MDAIVTTDRAAGAALDLPRAAVGLIIPSVNTMSEPQFNHFAPDGLGIHITRARVAGPWRRPLEQMAEEIAFSAKLLADCGPDLIVFHCTDTSMSARSAGRGPHPRYRPRRRRHRGAAPPAAWCSRRCARSE